MINFLQTLRERGFVQDLTPGLEERLLQGKPVTAYIGFDPTAESLHVGNLVPVMGLAWLQRAGGTPIPLVGGGTGMVGDPSGKRSERPILSVEQIDRNVASIRRQLERFVSFEGPTAARIRNNADWLRPLSLMEFLRDTGKHFTISYMLQKEAVKSRMETGISYTEFSYMLVQAYDFWHLFQTEGCELQMGGSDQWGNITAGCELVARREGTQVHGLVFPLLTTSSGAKFGKSEDANVWLDSAKTTPYQFYQFWLNTDDRDVERCLKLFTFVPLEEIAGVMAEQQREPGRRAAQRRLAEDLTARVHGQDTVNSVQAATEVLFGKGKFREADPGTLMRLAEELQPTQIGKTELGGLTLVDALVRVGLAKSKSEARRGLEAGGFSLNDEETPRVDRPLELTDFVAGQKLLLLRKGRKNYALMTLG